MEGVDCQREREKEVGGEVEGRKKEMERQRGNME